MFTIVGRHLQAAFAAQRALGGDHRVTDISRLPLPSAVVTTLHAQVVY